jgi:hypothetical protein
MALGSATHKRSSCMIALARTALCLIQKSLEAHPKQPVPARYGAVFFQETLLDEVELRREPPPRVPCSGPCEQMPLICGECRNTVYPRWILRSWDIADRKGAIPFVQDVGRCGSANCECCLLRVHPEVGRDRLYLPSSRIRAYIYGWQIK